MAAKKARRTTHRSRSGKKLYAKRTASGRFKDIQTHKRSSRADQKRRSRSEKIKRSAKKVAKKAARGARKTVRRAAPRRVAPKVKRTTTRPIEAVAPVAVVPTASDAVPGAADTVETSSHPVQSTVDSAANKF
jgi:hypothetical protein